MNKRTQTEIKALRDAFYQIVEAGRPMGIRQTFYQAVVRGLVPKTEDARKNTVNRLLSRMREDKSLPYHWITDNSRWMRKPTTWSSMESMLAYTVEMYRRSLWEDQDAYLEIWVEKDALAGVIYPETEIWDVPLMPAKGYASKSFLFSAAQALIEINKPTFIYLLGDWDPNGRHAPRVVEKELRGFAPGIDIHFERLAINEEQIVQWNLPTRDAHEYPTQPKWTRGMKVNVDLDAVPPNTLRNLVRTCIEQHINKRVLAATKKIEAEEKESMEEFLSAWQS